MEIGTDMIVLKADTPEEARKLANQDPMHRNGGRRPCDRSARPENDRRRLGALFDKARDLDHWHHLNILSDEFLACNYSSFWLSCFRHLEHVVIDCLFGSRVKMFDVISYRLGNGFGNENRYCIPNLYILCTDIRPCELEAVGKPCSRAASLTEIVRSCVGLRLIVVWECELSRLSQVEAIAHDIFKQLASDVGSAS